MGSDVCASGENLYGRVIDVGSKVVFCKEKCPNVEKSLKEGVLPRVLYAEPFLVDNPQEACRILEAAERARLIILGASPGHIMSFEKALYKQLLKYMNALEKPPEPGSERARTVFRELHRIWLEALGGWYFKCRGGNVEFRGEYRRKFRFLRYVRRMKEFLAYLYCHGNPLGLSRGDVIIWGELAFCQPSKKGAEIRRAAYKCMHHLKELASHVDIVLVTPTSEFLDDTGGKKQFKREFTEKLRSIFKGIFKAPIIGIPHPSRGKPFPNPSDKGEWERIAMEMKSVIEERGTRFINTTISRKSQ